VIAGHGVLVLTGNDFFFSETAETYLRLSISKLDESDISEGISRLAQALQAIYSG
jgi:DNA-binding transcriptional MocR family regulator